jgi:hypothetical protein
VSVHTTAQTPKIHKFVVVYEFLLDSYRLTKAYVPSIGTSGMCTYIMIGHIWNWYALVDEQSSKDKVGDEEEVQVSGLHNQLEKLDL